MAYAQPKKQVDSDAQGIAQAPQQCSSLLSFAQQRLWFLNQLEPSKGGYNIQAALTLTGKLNVAALEQSINEILRRHEALRSIFPTLEGKPVQVIVPTLTLTVPVVDLGELPETERETKASLLAIEEAKKPFDLASGPLLRITLLRLGEEKHVLLVTMHQIVFDAGSVGVFSRELEALYEVYSTGNPSELPELPIQYRDFVDWQQQWLGSEDYQTQLAYWKQQLAGAPPVLELPTDRQRAPVQTFRGARQSLEIPLTLTSSLKSLSQQAGVTLFMTLLAAFKVLLYRYTGLEDIIVGSPIPGRNRVESEWLIGLFVNPLVLRTDLSSNPSFRELLERVRLVALGAYAHQDLPFEKLVEELQPERNLSHHPLFQVMFAFQPSPTLNLKLPDLTVSPLEVESETTTEFDLTLELKETSEGLNGYFEYNTDLFDAATLTRMTGHFQTLLEGIVANPEQRMKELPLLTTAERQTLLVEWNNTQTDYPNLLLHQLFEAQVERTPDAVAIVFEDKQLTYQELNNRANQLAHHLQALGVKPDVSKVAICVERSLEMVVGLLGILKAGGGYVPVDPAYPTERVGYMLSDAQVPVLLTLYTLVDRLPEHGAHVVCLDTDWGVIATYREENPVSKVTGDNLAYVIYTSGSTGKPKGVQLCHRSVANFLNSMGQQPGLTDQDIILAVTTISFDIAVLELYLPLIKGAKVVLASRDVAANGTKLLEMLVNSGATIMQATPATWRLLLAAGWESSPRLKILGGGEALPRELALQLSERSTSLWNVYGPTETTVWSTAYKVEASRLARSKDAPESIGRPIANTQIYLLDGHLQPVPIGVPGELHIGGAGLARGYLNRPELTDEKFIPDPFSDEPGARLYKTGDLARYLPDGNIDYIGRIDHQVKVRGFRIELGEIEAVLTQHPAVRQAVVIAREDVPGDKRLVAYMVPAQEQIPPTSELRRFLKEQLPDYMVPAAFVKLDSLPLTPNGKVDRRALPAPDLVRQEPEETWVAPRDELELQLTKIWEKVLGIQPIGVRDNLFELGGHSLLAAHLSDQIEKAFNKNLPLATIFQAPTVEQLANILRQDASSAPRLSLTAIQPNGAKPPLFLCEGVSIYRPLIPYLGPEQPLYGLVASIRDGKHGPSNRVEALAAHYIQEMRTLQPEGPYFLAGLSFGGMIAYEMAQQLVAQGHYVALVTLFDTILPDAYRVLPLHERVCFHSSKLFGLGLTYVLEQVKARLQRLKERSMRIYSKFHLGRGGPVPHTLEYFAMLELNDEAGRNYVPRVYPDQVTLFKASDRVDAATAYVDPDLGWGQLAAGGLEIYEVPGDHLTMLKEPHVQVLAEKLRDCLDKAQARS